MNRKAMCALCPVQCDTNPEIRRLSGENELNKAIAAYDGEGKQ